MRLFKRHSNPIFVEEEQYNWRKKRSIGKRLLLAVLVCCVVVVGIAAYIN